ncbi:MAG: response regulator [Anaerolineaceae bacterium]|nr:response regulator [Anaerolineaceae bacterium]
MAHILLVDDNIPFSRVLALTLQESGHQVTVGNDGAEGLNILSNSGSPDFVVCDILMGGMDGLTFLQHVRQNPNWVSIPVVMMTSDPNVTQEHIAMEYGANGYLVKPFSFKLLEAILHKHGLIP